MAFPILAHADDVRLAQKTAQPAPKTANGPAGVAAEVNGEKIPLADVERAVNLLKESDPALKSGSAAANEALENIRQQHLENLIVQSLLSQDARKRKIAPAKADVDKAMAELQKGMTPDELKKALAADGKTLEDIRRMIVEDLSIRELSRQLTADFTVSEADVNASYRADAASWTAPETARASHILLAFENIPGVDKTKGPTAAQKAKLLAQANDIAKQAKGRNADFAALAKRYSEDPGSKDSGGDVGDFDRERMVKSFADAVFNNTVGSVVGPVESEFGYHIIRVTGKKPTALIPLDFVYEGKSVREIIRARLLLKKVQTRLESHLKELRAGAQIKKYI